MTLLEETPIDMLLAAHPAIADLLPALGRARGGRLGAWLDGLGEEDLSDAGMDAVQMLDQIRALLARTAGPDAGPGSSGALTIGGGRDKSGKAEAFSLEIAPGEVVCIVGPTGSGKSQLLADIECLADGDTPTGRHVRLAGWEGKTGRGRPVALLSQNMNFVIDLPAGEFVAMHAQCSGHQAPAEAAASVIVCANRLAGESFSADRPLTQLSGGQTRALMIADLAVLSRAPVVLIDEIENAGVDRRRALDLLISREKIVLISTHDPLLALRGDRRLAVRNGGIADIIATSAAERRILADLEAMDHKIGTIRDRLRAGGRLDKEGIA